MWCDIGCVWGDVMWCGMRLFHVMLGVVGCGVMWCDVGCRLMWCEVGWGMVWCDVIWGGFNWYDAMFCGVGHRLLWGDLVWGDVMWWDHINQSINHQSINQTVNQSINQCFSACDDEGYMVGYECLLVLPGSERYVLYHWLAAFLNYYFKLLLLFWTFKKLWVLLKILCKLLL